MISSYSALIGGCECTLLSSTPLSKAGLVYDVRIFYLLCKILISENVPNYSITWHVITHIGIR